MNRSPQSPQRSEISFDSVQGEMTLTLTFRWLGDRYGHTITARSPRGVTQISESSECLTDSSEFSPPVFQELSVEQIQGKNVLCLVGMSGKAYWSASIERLSGQAGFIFDLCSRGANAPRSAYVIPTALESTANCRLLIPIDDTWCCEASTAEHPEFATAFAGTPPILEVYGKSRDGLKSTSVRWSYQWQLKPNESIS